MPIQEQGIFRTAANETRRKELRNQMNNPNFEKFDHTEEVQDVVGTLMKYFIKEDCKLFSVNDNLNAMYSAATSSAEKPEPDVRAMEIIIKAMPLEKQQILKQIFGIFGEVVENQETTKMDSKNLGISIGATFLSDPCELEDQAKMRQIVKVIIENSDKLFPPTPDA
jgi:hypothetical protein